MAEWNQILQEEWYSQEEPDNSVINFFAALRKKSRRLKVLDLGCGAGRNLIYVASQGFESHGVDMSEAGLSLTKERVRKRNLWSHTAKSDMHFLPYIDLCFDVVLCLSTIYHQKLEGIKETISEIHRVLRKNGFLLLDLQSTKSTMYGKGLEIEKDSFIRHDGPEKGVIHHFINREEIMKFLKDFRKAKVELRERTSADGYFESRWLVVASV